MSTPQEEQKLVKQYNSLVPGALDNSLLRMITRVTIILGVRRIAGSRWNRILYC